MRTRVSCLQSRGLSILNESSQLCSNLLELVKGKAGQLPEAKQELDGQFFVESEMKVQGINRGTESFARSLQTMSGLLHEKSSLSTPKLASKSARMLMHQHIQMIKRPRLVAAEYVLRHS
ncbi:hypothetical protein C1H46_009515 [Malus baccata]|uniref:DUF7653 domain-containing protein n=1 Tax=Malus baccata TaxID=106549 RepID=A0A540N1I4_MALBA|nr:hypothetical protein C1H46_009515 [Malus baccata]